ncbi:MAG TPA: G5 domain-containing protein [Candidatus Saccharimonadales bacterium]
MRNKLSNARAGITRFRRMPRRRQIRRIKILSRHPFAVPFITFIVLLALCSGVYLLARQTNHLPVTHDAKIVIISHDHQQQIVPAKDATVGQLLHNLHLTLGEGDVVEPAASTPINQDQFRINIYRAVPVEIVDGANRTFAFSAATTPRAITQQAGISLFPEDTITNNPAENFLKTGAIGEQLTIDRAAPVDVDLYGTHLVMHTQATTISGFMKEHGIKRLKNDQIVPAPNTPLVPGQHVAFIRTGTKVEAVTEDIAMPVQQVNDPTLAYGTKAVRQQGSAGQQVVTYQVQLVNNVETSRTVIQTVVNKQPVTQIEVIGTSLSGIKGDMALAGIAPGDYNYADYIISHESGWRPDAGNASGAYGLCQALPGSKMASAGADWATNPITQLKWCSGYASSRYGGWAGAYNHWLSSHNW